MVKRFSVAAVILICMAVGTSSAEVQNTSTKLAGSASNLIHGDIFKKAKGTQKETKETVTRENVYSEGSLGGNIITVGPEVATPVEMSSSDMNRIQCSSEIKDVVFSKEKGITVKILGKNAFVKFLIAKRGDKEAYSSIPTELFIACDESIYNIVAIPKRIPSQTIRLNAGVQRIKKNAALYTGMPFERKVVSIVKSIYTDEIPDSFTVEQSGKRVDVYKDIAITLQRSVSVEGEGITVKEYKAAIRGESERSHVEISERDFLRAELTTRPVSIFVDRLKLTKGIAAKVLIIESTSAGSFKGEDAGEGK